MCLHLSHEYDLFVRLDRPVGLSEAIARVKVSSGEEDEDRVGLIDVLLEHANVLKVVHVEEDVDAGEQHLKLRLDDSRLVLTGSPDVREEEVEALVHPEGKLRARERQQLTDLRQLALLPHLVARHKDDEKEEREGEAQHDGHNLNRGLEAHHLLRDR